MVAERAEDLRNGGVRVVELAGVRLELDAPVPKASAPKEDDEQTDEDRAEEKAWDRHLNNDELDPLLAMTDGYEQLRKGDRR